MSIWLVLGILACAVGAISARRLVDRALCLAATSVLLAVLLAALGAPIVAVIEVSVGAGLVAVLFLFTIGIAGEDGMHGKPVVPRSLALMLVVPAALLVLWLTRPGLPVSLSAVPTVADTRALADVLWQDRAVDMLGQAALVVVAALAARSILGSDRAARILPAVHDAAVVVDPAPAGVTVEVAPASQPSVSPAQPVGVARSREEVRT